MQKFGKRTLFLKKHPDALQFILYHDDIEVSNPLGAAADMHKLGRYNELLCYLHMICLIYPYVGMFYYTLGNIHPMFKSQNHITCLCG